MASNIVIVKLPDDEEVKNERERSLNRAFNDNVGFSPTVDRSSLLGELFSTVKTAVSARVQKIGSRTHRV